MTFNSVQHGTSGDDVIYGFAGGDTIFAEGGHDAVAGGGGDDELYGGDGWDDLYGDGGDDDLHGGDGYDELHGGAGADDLDGGDNWDYAIYSNSAAGVTVNLETGLGAGGSAEGDTLAGIEGLEGSAHDDTLLGNGDANYIFGVEGNDFLKGGGGDDTLWGDGGGRIYGHYAESDGDDTLKGGGGADMLWGGGGIDTAAYDDSPAGVIVSLELFTSSSGGDAEGDWLFEIENLTGSGHDDDLGGDDGANVLAGLSGADLLVGLGGADSLIGGDDSDMLKGGGGADILDGGSGDDTAAYDTSDAGVTVALIAAAAAGGDADGDTLVGIENLTGSIHADALGGDDGANALDGLNGNDALKGYGGADSLQGGANDDTLDGGDGADALAGGSGSDTAAYAYSDEGVTVSLIDATAAGGDADGDTFDSIENLTGSSHVDWLEGDDDANVLGGASGNDWLKGLGGADSLAGGDDNDTLLGMDDVDALYGDGGNDTLVGGTGGDTMVGGIGDDTYDVDDAADVVTEHAAEGTDLVYARISYTLGAHVENLTLTTGAGALDGTGNGRANVITGNDSANVIRGGAGSDTAYGEGGDDVLYGQQEGDTLHGGSGNDTLDGGLGIDTMFGDDGDDAYIVNNAADVVTEAVGQGTLDRVQASVTYSLAAGSEVEVLETTDAAGTTALDLVGNEFDNAIVGNNAGNTIIGSPDSDGGGYDGLDTMTGNGGGDTFVWTSTAETTLAGQEADVVTDFNRAEGDLLAFNQIDADATGGTADDAFTFVGIVDVTAGDSFTGVGQIGYFTADTDGNGAADQTYILLNTEVDAGVDYQDATIRLAGAFTVDASWFVL
jgi:Ca2+-binding RTX toxin-like protein